MHSHIAVAWVHQTVDVERGEGMKLRGFWMWVGGVGGVMAMRVGAQRE